MSKENVANKALNTNGTKIVNNVVKINKSHIIMGIEKSNIKAQSSDLLANIMTIIRETDNKALNELNPTYNGVNHAYIKVQSLLSAIDETDSKTDKLIKVINKVLLTSPNVPFSQFIKTFKDFEVYAKNVGLLRNIDYTNNDDFNNRINDIIMLKTFVSTYLDDEKRYLISKELRVALSDVSCDIKINNRLYTNWIEIIKAVKIASDVIVFDSVLTAYKEAITAIK